MIDADQLDADVHALKTRLGHLHAMCLAPSATADTGSTQRHKITGSPAPWHGEAAGVLYDVHAGARDLENRLRRCDGLADADRGTSWKTVGYALDAVCDLARKHPATGPARDAAQDVARWLRAADQVLGRKQRLLKARGITETVRNPDGTTTRRRLEPTCTYCGCTTMRWHPVKGIALCVNPACRDDEGRRHVATLTTGPYSGQPALVYRDGTEITYTDDGGDT